MPLEVKVQLEDTSVEATFEAMALRHLPLLVDNGESDVLVGDTRTEPNSQSVCSPVGL